MIFRIYKQNIANFNNESMDNLYPIKELKRPNFFQRLFNLVLKENAIIEINNLLGTKPLNGINIGEIESISAKYKVNLHKKFPDQLKELYQCYLSQCLADNVLTDIELNELNSLKHLLVLTDSEVSDLHINMASEIFRKSYDVAISNGTFEKSKEEFIDMLQKNLRLPDEIANKIIDEGRNHFLDVHLKKLASNRKISPEEWDEFMCYAKNLKVELKFDDATKHELIKFKLYWVIENGELPVEEIDINLQKNEYCYFTGNADWLENRTVTQRINYGGPVLRFKIMKGIYYRAGSVQVQRITTEQLLEIDFGMVYVTNKRIIFVGNKKNTNIHLSKILSVTPYSDGVGIEKDSGKSPIFRVICDADILAMVLGRVINDLYNSDKIIIKEPDSFNEEESQLNEYQNESLIESNEIDLKNRDELFDDAARIVVMNQTGSTSAIQRKFSIGYNRAGRIMDQLEAAGIVGQNEGSKARQVLLQDEYALEQLLRGLDQL